MAIRLSRGDIRVGTALLWPVYDAQGNLLLREGYIVSSEKQLERLIAGGLYRTSAGETRPGAVRETSRGEEATPFSRLEDIVLRLGKLLDRTPLAPPEFTSRLTKLAEELTPLCTEHVDAALGFVHQFRDAPYTHAHPLKMAIVAHVLAQVLLPDTAKQRSLVCACLTCNVAMLDLQSVLQVQSEPVTPDQHEEIQSHPIRSAKLLATLRVQDRDWLETVLRHHERSDGSGYPHGLKGDAIPLAARILAVCDRYAASTSNRAYKRSLTPVQALQSAFVEQRDGLGEYDPEIVAALIRRLGVYPPGSTVQLANGERAIVIHRNPGKSTEPVAVAVESPDGKPYATALRRDTSTAAFKITQPAALGHPLRLPLGYLWGYKERA